jgi:Toastrack DUF4097
VTVFATPGDVLLRVAVGGGEITVVTGDEPEVAVDVVASADTLEAVRVDHVERAGRHEVTIEVDKKRGLLGIGRTPSIDLRVRCPHGADLDVTTSSADLDVRGHAGSVTAKSASGDFALGSVRGRCELSTASGDASIGDVEGDVKVKTASGDIEITHADGPVSANLVSGDLVLERASGDVTVNSVSGDVRVDAVSAGVKITSVSGDIRLGVVDGLRLWIDASSVSGTMSSELDMVDERPDADGEIVEIRARTVSGDLTIARAGVGAGTP